MTCGPPTTRRTKACRCSSRRRTPCSSCSSSREVGRRSTGAIQLSEASDEYGMSRISDLGDRRHLLPLERRSCRCTGI